MRTAAMLVVVVGLVGCGGSPFTTAAPWGDDAGGDAAPPAVAQDEPVAQQDAAVAAEAGPVEAAVALPEAGEAAVQALCSGTCTPFADAGAFPYVRCAGQCAGNCYGVCHIQTLPDQMVAGTPCVPGVCDGYCDAECILKGGASVACDGTCG